MTINGGELTITLRGDESLLLKDIEKAAKKAADEVGKALSEGAKKAQNAQSIQKRETQQLVTVTKEHTEELRKHVSLSDRLAGKERESIRNAQKQAQQANEQAQKAMANIKARERVNAVDLENLAINAQVSKAKAEALAVEYKLGRTKKDALLTAQREAAEAQAGYDTRKRQLELEEKLNKLGGSRTNAAAQQSVWEGQLKSLKEFKEQAANSRVELDLKANPTGMARFRREISEGIANEIGRMAMSALKTAVDTCLGVKPESEKNNASSS